MIVLVDIDAFPDPLVYEAAVREYARQHPVEAVYATASFPYGTVAALYHRRASVHVVSTPDRARTLWAPLTDPLCDLTRWVFEMEGWKWSAAKEWLKKDAAARARSNRTPEALDILTLVDFIRTDADVPLEPLVIPDLPAAHGGVTYTLLDEIGVRSFISTAEDSIWPYLVALDFETDTLDYTEALAVGFSFSVGAGEAYYVPVRHQDGPNVSVETARDLLRVLTEVPWVAHNSPFELAVLHNEGIEPAVWPDDTMDLARLAGYPAGLKDAVANVLGVQMIRFEDIAPNKKFSTVAPEAAVAYACADADMTRRLFLSLTDPEAIGQEDPRLARAWGVYRDYNKPLIPVLHGMYVRGMRVDRAGLQAWRNGLAEAEAALVAAIRDVTGIRNLEPASNDKMSRLLFDHYGLDPLRRTLKGYSVDEATLLALLDQIPEDHPAAPVLRLLQAHRETNKLLGTYGDGFLAASARDARLHGHYSGARTRTGRLAGEGPNPQNVPTDARRFVIPDAGSLLVAADYSQIELRVLAHLSQSPKMLADFRNGVSPHERTLEEVFGVTDKKAYPKQYTLSKNLNFGDVYGSGAATMVEQARQGGIRVSVTEMEELQRKKRKADPWSWEWIQTAREEAGHLGYADTIQGRRAYDDRVFGLDQEVRAEAIRFLVNSRIQGTAGLFTIEAMLAFFREWTWPLLIQVHDEIVIQARRGSEALALEKLRAAMVEAAQKWIPTVPVEVEGKWAERWSDLK